MFKSPPCVIRVNIYVYSYMKLNACMYDAFCWGVEEGENISNQLCGKMYRMYIHYTLIALNLLCQINKMRE